MKSVLALLTVLMAGPVWAKGACDLEVSADRIVYGKGTAVFVGEASVPMVGQTKDGAFEPSFPLTPGINYRAEAQDCPPKRFVLQNNAPAPRVLAIYPQSETLPENILRFYIAFSEPMREGRFLDHITLTDETTGKDLSGVFFDNVHELWSPDRKQVTLLVDPGRVKTGLISNRRLGRAFLANHNYRLAVVGDWLSLAGRALSAPFEKHFTAIEESRTAVAPDEWRLTAPRVGTRLPLIVDFQAPMDHISIQTYLRTVDRVGKTIPGEWRVLDAARRAAFTPDHHWDHSPHQLHVYARFEDVAANNINGAFDHEKGMLKRRDEEWVVSLAFRPIKP